MSEVAVVKEGWLHKRGAWGRGGWPAGFGVFGVGPLSFGVVFCGVPFWGRCPFGAVVLLGPLFWGLLPFLGPLPLLGWLSFRDRCPVGRHLWGDRRYGVLFLG